MALELIKDKWTNNINEVMLGADKPIKVGGENTLPFLFQEGDMPNRPVVAMEVWDMEPPDWPAHLKAALGDAVKSPVEWAKKAISEFGADLIVLRLQSANPETGNASADKVAETLKSVLAAIDVPLIVIGCGDDQKDNDIMPKCCQAAKGKNCLFGLATEDNYKTLTVSCMADGHSIIAESPIDINIAKQVNILITDMGFDAKRIVMHPTTASLGYGMEYVYSIMERARLAALNGDKMLAMPFILFVGQEVWRVKEAKEEEPGWGDVAKRGHLWEMTTAINMLQAGADILVMRHPQAFKDTKKAIERLMKK